jgi:hypothetical protein
VVSECATWGLDQEVEISKVGRFDGELAEEVRPCGLDPLRTHERTSHEDWFIGDVTDDFADDLNREHQRGGAYITGQRRSRNRARWSLTWLGQNLLLTTFASHCNLL